MNKLITVIIAVALLCGAGYIVLGYTGYVNTPFNTTSLYPNAQEIDTTSLSEYVDADIYAMISGLMDELNIQVYGVNGQSASSVISWYESTNLQNGWTPLSDASADSSGTGWSSYIRGWQKGFPGRGQIVITWDGSKVEQYSGYDTVVLTSSAPMTTYLNIIDSFQN